MRSGVAETQCLGLDVMTEPRAAVSALHCLQWTTRLHSGGETSPLPLSRANQDGFLPVDRRRTFFKLHFNCHIVVVLGIHCDIYKSAYNVS
jgi:hypothetical protein